jgi:hypothetical protein
MNPHIRLDARTAFPADISLEIRPAGKVRILPAVSMIGFIDF